MLSTPSPSSVPPESQNSDIKRKRKPLPSSRPTSEAEGAEGPYSASSIHAVRKRVKIHVRSFSSGENKREDESAQFSDDSGSSSPSNTSRSTWVNHEADIPEFVIEIRNEIIPKDRLSPKATKLCVMCDKLAYYIHVPVTTMSNFVLVASYSHLYEFDPHEVNQSLAVLTKGLTPLLPGIVVIAALSWSLERTPRLNLEDVTGRDIVFALDKLKFEDVGLCNPDPSRNKLPSVPGIKITDFNNPFFECAYGADHKIESMQPVQVLKRELRYKGHEKMFGCTLPFLLGLPWITRADNDHRWVIKKTKIEKPINLRYLNFQFDAADKRFLQNIQLSKEEDQQAAPCHYGTFVLVHLLGVKIYPYHISALCDYLDYCFRSTATPSKEGFLDSWRQWCQEHDGDGGDFISPYDTEELEETDFPNDGIGNLWGKLGECLIKDIENCSAAILEDLWPVSFGDACLSDDSRPGSESSYDGGVPYFP
ncbi:hypothetical protein QBC32DRAFT_376425 [Pseudoneurospora amorphoporcata]|uniref:Uncharacterized protein n=1 Tax=Pseudoneurospora amorphoporcata TaxID=241081 RepID=A0AAN6P5B2_9PEZI|nr:hypothetical protein QBC32DRAFT_376425 [Pseudoneurospora amorphoporcata]